MFVTIVVLGAMKEKNSLAEEPPEKRGGSLTISDKKTPASKCTFQAKWNQRSFLAVFHQSHLPTVQGVGAAAVGCGKAVPRRQVRRL